MDEDFKPIQTRYNGYYFRSRTEARWAVFFDGIGMKYEYEPEGFKLRNGEMYLPDFYINDFHGYPAYFEIKPDTYVQNDWLNRLEFLQELTEANIFLLNGPPDFKRYRFFEEISDQVFEENKEWRWVNLSMHPRNQNTGLANMQIEIVPAFELKKVFTENYIQAVNKSRSARFA